LVLNLPNGNGHEDDGEIAAEQLAQHLANALQKPVADKEPEPGNYEGPREEELLNSLLNGDIQPRVFDEDMGYLDLSINSPFIIISGLLNGAENLRIKILSQVDRKMFMNTFHALLFDEVKAITLEGDPGKEEILAIRDRIPELWMSVGNDPLEGPLRLGVYYRWLQIEQSRCKTELVTRAIDALYRNNQK